LLRDTCHSLTLYLVLDPRINYKQLQIDYENDEDLLHYLEMSVLDLRAHYRDRYHTTSQYTPPEPIKPTQVASSSRNRLPLNVNFTARYSTKEAVERDELEEYFKVDREDKWELCNPLEWWVGRHAQFPNLFKLARDILTIPGMSITSFQFLAHV
jgi:hypothetical protein